MNVKLYSQTGTPAAPASIAFPCYVAKYQDPTSTGNGEEYTSTKGRRAIATTPRGSFTVYRAVDGPVTNSLGQLWRPRFFNRGIAVHGSPNIPPYAASHGCARLSNAAIDMIWAKDLMPIGSRVLVR